MSLPRCVLLVLSIVKVALVVPITSDVEKPVLQLLFGEHNAIRDDLCEQPDRSEPGGEIHRRRPALLDGCPTLGGLLLPDMVTEDLRRTSADHQKHTQVNTTLHVMHLELAGQKSR